MLNRVASACKALACDFNDLWVCAGLTDWSYEEGDRNVHYARAIDSYAAAGAPAPLIDQMRRGINGTLADLLSRDPALHVKRNMGKGQDLIIEAAVGHAMALVEVKLVYDCTFATYYPKVAADWDKLLKRRDEGYAAGLFLVVFFVQFPQYQYAGAAGRRQVVCAGIDGQFDRVRPLIPQSIAWPDERPFKHPLHPPSDGVVRDAIAKRFDAAFSLRGAEFDLNRQLQDAAVGVAIWQCRGCD